METETYEIPSLGRPFMLGSLYDARKDILLQHIPFPPLKDSDESILEVKCPATDVSLIASETLNEKTNSMELRGSLKLSALFGKIKNSASLSYLEDKITSKYQARVTISYKQSNKQKSFSLDQILWLKKNPHYLDIAKRLKATHITVGITYGANVYLVFDCKTCSMVEKLNVQSKLLKRFGIDDFTHLHPGENNDITCKIHGDILADGDMSSLSTKVRTFEKAMEFYKNLPSHLPPGGVPVRIHLLPLSFLDRKAIVYRPIITDDHAQMLTDILEGLSDAQIRCFDIRRRDILNTCPTLSNKSKWFCDRLEEYKKVMEKTFEDMLKCSSKDQCTNLVKDFGMKNKTSPFSSNPLDRFMSSVEDNVDLVEDIVKVVGPNAFRSDSNPQGVPRSPATDQLFECDIGLVGERDDFMDDIENFLNGKDPQPGTRESERNDKKRFGIHNGMRTLLEVLSTNKSKIEQGEVVFRFNEVKDLDKLGTVEMKTFGKGSPEPRTIQPPEQVSISWERGQIELTWTYPKYENHPPAFLISCASRKLDAEHKTAIEKVTSKQSITISKNELNQKFSPGKWQVVVFAEVHGVYGPGSVPLEFIVPGKTSSLRAPPAYAQHDITFQVVVGDITEEATDAIVNSTGHDFRFIGAVAESIKRKCRPSLRIELEDEKARYPKENILSTSSHGLPCKEIFHVKLQQIEGLKRDLYGCLEKANENKFSSIAFPLLGAGGIFQTFSPETIAEALCDVVEDFFHKHHHPDIKVVKLVVYRRQRDALYQRVLNAVDHKVSSTKMPKPMVYKEPQRQTSVTWSLTDLGWHQTNGEMQKASNRQAANITGDESDSSQDEDTIENDDTNGQCRDCRLCKTNHLESHLRMTNTCTFCAQWHITNHCQRYCENIRDCSLCRHVLSEKVKTMTMGRCAICELFHINGHVELDCQRCRRWCTPDHDHFALLEEHDKPEGQKWKKCHLL